MIVVILVTAGVIAAISILIGWLLTSIGVGFWIAAIVAIIVALVVGLFMMLNMM